MIIALLALWFIAIILWVADRKQASTRWASITAIVGSFGFLSGVLNDTLRPYLREHFAGLSYLDEPLRIVTIFSSSICQLGLPYAYLMYAIHYSQISSKKWRDLIQYSALAPLLLMIYITPFYPDLRFNYLLLILWAAPYILFASYLLGYAYWQETNPQVKKNRLFSAIIAVIPLLFSLYTIYGSRIYGDTEAWRWNGLMIIVQFIAFIIFSIKYGVLGVKINLEMRRLDNTIRVFHSGTAVLNHTLKNEMEKIKLFAERIHAYASKVQQEDVLNDVEVILRSTRQVLEMSVRIQQQMHPITLVETPNTLIDIVKEVVLLMKPYAEEKDIRVTVDVSSNSQLLCDRLHIREVFNNVLMNAIEAMNSAGDITIRIYEIKKTSVVSVRDQGEGIAKENLAYLFDPFFSTKQQQRNYGLGLTHCYNVMKKHGGSLYLHSVVGEGTTVFLHFPQSRVIHRSNQSNYKAVI